MVTDHVRRAVERLYKGVAVISELKAEKNEATGGELPAKFVPVAEDVKCRLSFSTVRTTDESESTAAVVQVVKLFCSPDITIKPGSRITVEQEGRTTVYEASGAPAVYRSHQEVILTIPRGTYAQ